MAAPPARAASPGPSLLEDFPATFGLLPAGVALVGPAGRVLRANPALSALTGRAPADLLGADEPDLAAASLRVRTTGVDDPGGAPLVLRVAVAGDEAALDRAQRLVDALLVLRARLPATSEPLSDVGAAVADVVRVGVGGDVSVLLLDADDAGAPLDPVATAAEDPDGADELRRLLALAPQLRDDAYVARACAGETVVVDSPWDPAQVAAAAPGRPPVSALLLVPLVHGDRPFGVLMCCRHGDEPAYDDVDRDHVRQVAARSTPALAMARLAAVHADAVRRERAVAGVVRRCDEVGAEPAAVLDGAARSVAEELGCGVAVWLLDDDTAEHLGRGGVSHPDPDLEAFLRRQLRRPGLAVGPFFSGVLQDGRAHVLGTEATGRLLEHWSELHEIIDRHAPSDLYGVRLDARGRAVGVLVAASGRTPLSPSDRRLVDVLAARIAVAVDNARLLAVARASQRRHRALVRHGSDMLLMTDRDGAVTYASPAAARTFGRRLGESVLAAVVDADRDQVEQRWRDVLADPGTSHQVDLRVLDADGRERRLSAVANNLVDDPAVEGVVLTIRDVTEEREAAEQLADQAAQQAALAQLGATALTASLDELMGQVVKTVSATLHFSAVGVLELLPDGSWRVLGATTDDHGVAAVLPPGASAGLDLLARTGAPVIVDDYRRTDVVDERHVVTDFGIHSGALVPIHVEGRLWGCTTVHSLELRRFSSVDQDFLQTVATLLAGALERARIAERLLVQATRDALTGLPNRVHLHDELSAALERVTEGGSAVALLLLDLDDFKDVNDSLGHGAGDLVLAQLGKRLLTVVGGRATVARLGGDEFAVCITGAATEGEAVGVAHRVIAAMHEPFSLPGIDVTLSTSIGIAVAPAHADEPEQLLQAADMAMYRAKGDRSGWALYDLELDRQRSERLALLAELRTALTEGQLELHYQPLVDLRSERVVEVEALVRWRHPTRGLLLPGAFVPLTEQTELVHEFTRHVVRLAAAQARRWRAEGWPGTVAVNVSAVALRPPWVVEELQAALDEGEGALTVEITESALVDERARAAIEQLSADGIPCAIDDFGTGWSSLASLASLPVTRLKLDRGFNRRVDVDERDALIVGGVVALAHSIGLDVVAEGVETATVAARLRALAVDVAQGWLYGRAVPADELGLP